MRNIKIFILIFLLSSELTAQTKLTIFSEDNNTFIANLNSANLAKEGSNYFVFSNVNIETVVLDIILDNNQKLNKTIHLENNRHNIYSIANENDVFKIRFRGSYKIDEDIPEFEFTKDWNYKPELEIAFSSNSGDGSINSDKEPIKLIDVNTIFQNIESLNNDRLITESIVKSLSSKNYNCRQLKSIFSKVKTDYSKLYIFKSTINNCVDTENLVRLKKSYNTQQYRDRYIKLISSLK